MPTASAIDAAPLYATNCAGCHGSAGQGGLGIALVGVASTITQADAVAAISAGKGLMPAFPTLTVEQVEALATYARTSF